MRLKSYSRRWLPLLIWMALIFIVSHQPKETIPAYGQWDLIVKKGGHVIAYGILAILARRAGFRERSALLLTFLYAVSDEFHQRFVPGRTGTVLDVFIDALGATMSLLLLRHLPPYWRVALLGQTIEPDEP